MDFVWLEKIPKTSTKFYLRTKIEAGSYYREFNNPKSLVLACGEPFYDFRRNILYLGEGNSDNILFCPKAYKEDLLDLIKKVNDEFNKEMND